MTFRIWEDTPAMRRTTVRLCLIALLLAVAVWIEWNDDPVYPVLLLPMGILSAGIALYGSWTLWQLWRYRRD